MSTIPSNLGSPPSELRHNGSRGFICQTADNHRMPVSESEIVLACYQAQCDATAIGQRIDEFSIAMRDIRNWCERAERIEKAAISATENEYSVVFVARDEDAEGDLHDQMVDLEIELNTNRQAAGRFDFILLRQSEKAGLFSFAEPARSPIIFDRAQRS